MCIARTLRLVFTAIILILVPCFLSFGQNCSNSSIGFLPLNDLGTGSFRGVTGGLYPGGSNVRPTPHLNDGVSIAWDTKPLNWNGNVDSSGGKIVMLSIGMSNAQQEFDELETMVGSFAGRNRYLQVVNGAQGGWEINRILDPDSEYWTIVSEILAQRNLTEQQVQIIWFKQAEADPGIIATDTTFYGYTEMLKRKMKEAINLLKEKYPNAKLCYMASRIYGGYATTTLNPEPFAYYNGWAVKGVIEDQISGDEQLAYAGADPQAPWLCWGPYLWADGLTPRNDGLSWACPNDFQSDGTHPSETGREKVATILFDFFRDDVSTRPWFLDGTLTSVGTGSGLHPASYSITNYPNPFNPSTRISFQTPVNGPVRVVVYDMIGQEVSVLYDGEIEAGTHEVQFNAPAGGSGVYFYHLTSGNVLKTGRMLLLK